MTTAPIRGELRSGTYVRQRALLEIIPFSHATLWRYVKAGTFPAPIRIGQKAVAWAADDVNAWLASRRQAA